MQKKTRRRIRSRRGVEVWRRRATHRASLTTWKAGITRMARIPRRDGCSTAGGEAMDGNVEMQPPTPQVDRGRSALLAALSSSQSYFLRTTSSHIHNKDIQLSQEKEVV